MARVIAAMGEPRGLETSAAHDVWTPPLDAPLRPSPSDAVSSDWLSVPG